MNAKTTRIIQCTINVNKLKFEMKVHMIIPNITRNKMATGPS